MTCVLMAMSILATSPEAIADSLKLREIGFSYELKNMIESGRVSTWENYDAHVSVFGRNSAYRGSVKVRIMENGEVYWTREEHDVVCDAK